MNIDNPKKPKRGPTVRTDRARARAKEKFLKRLAESCNVSDASRVAGIARSTAHDWKAADGEFSAAWDQAIEVARDALEAEARRRAVEGWDEPIFQQGRQVGVIRRYSDRMLEVLLKGHRPQFREKGVEVGVGIKLEPSIDPVELARRVHHLLRKARTIEAETVPALEASHPEARLPAPAEPVPTATQDAPQSEPKDYGPDVLVIE